MNQISCLWFQKAIQEGLNREYDWETHLITGDLKKFPKPYCFYPELEGRSAHIWKVERIGFECIVRGYLAGSSWKEYQSKGNVCGQELPSGLLRIEEVTITGTGLRAGSLAGELRSGGQVAGVGIVNADFSSTATTGINQPTSTESIGGLIGYGDGGSITNSYSMVAVRSTTRSVGGLVGYNAGSITNSYSTGDVSGTGNDIGGLVGYNEGSSITNSYSTGDVKTTGNNIGGLVGFSDGRITNSYSTGDVSGTANIGGLGA